MKRFLLVLLTQSIFSACYAQEGKTPIYLGLQVSPNFSYRVLSNNSGEPSVDDEIDYLNNREDAAFGYRIAAVGGLRVSNNWTLEAGVAYVENCTNFNLTTGDQPDPRRGFVFEESLESLDLKNCLAYVGIPIRIIWNFGTDKAKVMASFGLSPQILLNQRTLATRSYKNGDEEQLEIENFEDAAGFNLSPSFGIGAEYMLSQRFFLRAEGIARFGVVNVNEDSPINSNLYSSELNVGIYYSLAKNKNGDANTL